MRSRFHDDVLQDRSGGVGRGGIGGGKIGGYRGTRDLLRSRGVMSVREYGKERRMGTYAVQVREHGAGSFDAVVGAEA